MRAALLTGYRNDFEIGTVADPVITDPMDVIVHVCAAGFCRTDVHIWQGELAELQRPPACSSRLSAVTRTPAMLPRLASVSAMSRSAMRCCCTRWPRVGSVLRAGQGWTCIVSPRSSPASARQVDSPTAYRAVKKALPRALPGSHVVIIGAGGVGHIGIQALRAMCAAEITVVDRNPAALEHARKWGADNTVVVADDGSHVDEVREITSGGAQAVLDFVGEGGTENEAIRMVGRHGIDIIVGYGGRIDVDVLADIVTTEVTVAGSLVGSYTELVELVALTKRGAVTCSTVTYGLDGINDAMTALEAGKIVGRGVLVP